MYSTYRHGALTVVETAHDANWIVRELKQIDDRLFLEKQMTIANEEVWCVVVDLGLQHPPITILEWRDESGNPIPHLASGIVERIRKMDRDRDNGRVIDRVIKANRDMIERRNHERQEWYREVATEMEARNHRSALLPRGQYLRIARDRERARGKKI